MNADITVLLLAQPESQENVVFICEDLILRIEATILSISARDVG